MGEKQARLVGQGVELRRPCLELVLFMSFDPPANWLSVVQERSGSLGTPFFSIPFVFGRAMDGPLLRRSKASTSLARLVCLEKTITDEARNISRGSVMQDFVDRFIPQP